MSVAGTGKGIAEGTRSGLWFEMRRIIGEVRPRWVLAENVAALRHRGGDGVLADLEGLGYSCWPVVVGAVHAGAPHRRQRVWIVGRLARAGGEAAEPARSGAREADAGERERLADAERGQREVDGRAAGSRRCERTGDHAAWAWPSRPGEPQHEWEEPRVVEFSLGGPTDGLPPRLVLDRLRRARNTNRNALRAYGNSVVPQVVEMIGRWMMQQEREP